MGKLFWTCPFCQSNLDLGEKCDCLEVNAERERARKLRKRQQLLMNGWKEDGES